MRTFILIWFVTMLGAVEITQLPKEVAIDPKQLLGGKEHELFDTGYVTKRMQMYGYLDAKVKIQDGKMVAIPGERFTIRSLTIKGATPERQACEIPITPDNTQLLQSIFSDFAWGRALTLEDHGVHYTLTPE